METKNWTIVKIAGAFNIPQKRLGLWAKDKTILIESNDLADMFLEIGLCQEFWRMGLRGFKLRRFMENLRSQGVMEKIKTDPPGILAYYPTKGKAYYLDDNIAVDAEVMLIDLAEIFFQIHLARKTLSEGA